MYRRQEFDAEQLKDPKNLKYPATMLMDWIRIYQDPTKMNVGCDPEDFPTAYVCQLSQPLVLVIDLPSSTYINVNVFVTIISWLF
jgi:hypothetical protein